MDSSVQPISELEQELQANGYTVLRNFFDSCSIEFLRNSSCEMSVKAQSILEKARDENAALSDFARRNPSELIVVPETLDANRVCRYEYLLGSNSRFRLFIMDTILDVINSLVGEEFTPFKDKCNEKYSGGGAFGPHQDFTAYQSFPPRYSVTAMIAIDAMTRQNGCVRFASNLRELTRIYPGHVKALIDGRALLHSYSGGSNHGDIRHDIARGMNWKPIEVGPSDLVLFDSFVPHYSQINHSSSSRRAIFVSFTPQREGQWYDYYYSEKRERFDDPIFHVSTPTKHEHDGKTDARQRRSLGCKNAVAGEVESDQVRCKA